MAVLDLTDTERLLLANQYEILGLLKEDDSYSRLANQLRDGHKWLYRQHAARIEDNLPDDLAEHVLTILGIYSDLRDSYKQLTDKSGIEERDVAFPGFDGNNESELLGFAGALSKNGNFSDTIGERPRNSHTPTTEMYRRQVQQWKALGSPQFPLSKDQMLAIISARNRPRSGD